MNQGPGPPPFRGLPNPFPPLDVAELRRRIEKEFRVYEVDSDQRGYGRDVAAFYVMAEPKAFETKFELVRDSIHDLDPQLEVILQHRLGEDVLVVARRAPPAKKSNRLNVVLLILTAATTTLAGAFFWLGYMQIEGLLNWFDTDVSVLHPSVLAAGFLTFGFPLMTILGVHELGHWWIARRHAVTTSLPYFIPVPPPLPFGTFGAFISMRQPIPNRKALFDIGAAGPIAGFIVALPVFVLGLMLTAAVAQPEPLGPEVHSQLVGPNGTTWGFDADETVWTAQFEDLDDERVWMERIVVETDTPGFAPGQGWRLLIDSANLEETAHVRYQIMVIETETAETNQTLGGTFIVEPGDASGAREIQFSLSPQASTVEVLVSWDRPAPGLISLGQSVASTGLAQLVELFIETPEDVLIHPIGLAGWVGLLVTGFNLLPAGQLDGGHVARAVWGDRMKYASWLAVGMMVALSFVFRGWLLLAIVVLLLGVRHPPPLNDRTQLDTGRKILAAIVGLILLVTFVPIPIEAIG